MRAYHQLLRFRNRIVHGYLDVDNGRLYEMMSGSDLDDIEEVLAAFAAVASASPQAKEP